MQGEKLAEAGLEPARGLPPIWILSPDASANSATRPNRLFYARSWLILLPRVSLLTPMITPDAVEVWVMRHPHGCSRRMSDIT